VVDLFAPEFERLRQFVGAGALEAKPQESGKPAGTATARESARKATGGRLGPNRKSRKRRGGPRKGTNKTTPRRAD
jgi:hypothetical protein